MINGQFNWTSARFSTWTNGLIAIVIITLFVIAFFNLKQYITDSIQLGIKTAKSTHMIICILATIGIIILILSINGKLVL